MTDKPAAAVRPARPRPHRRGRARRPRACSIPATVGAEPATLVHDLPGGALRLIAGAIGVVRVFVNGVETVVDGEATGALPGTVLRSGRDTDTVTVH